MQGRDLQVSLVERQLAVGVEEVEKTMVEIMA